MNTELSPPDLNSAASMILDYAREHNLTPREMCSYFTVGLTAADLLRVKRVFDQSKVSVTNSSGAPLLFETFIGKNGNDEVLEIRILSPNELQRHSGDNRIVDEPPASKFHLDPN